MGKNRLDAGKSNEQLLAERSQRIADALNLKQPDRIPVSMGRLLPLRVRRRDPPGAAGQRCAAERAAREGRLRLPAGHDLRPLQQPAHHRLPRRPHDQVARVQPARDRLVPVRRARVHEGRGLRRVPARSVRLDRPHVPAAGVQAVRRVPVPAAVLALRVRPLWSGLPADATPSRRCRPHSRRWARRSRWLRGRGRAGRERRSACWSSASRPATSQGR